MPYKCLRVWYQKRVLDPVSHKHLMAFKNVLTRLGVMAGASNFTSWEAEQKDWRSLKGGRGSKNPTGE